MGVGEYDEGDMVGGYGREMRGGMVRRLNGGRGKVGGDCHGE